MVEEEIVRSMREIGELFVSLHAKHKRLMKQKLYLLSLIMSALPFTEKAGAQEVTLTITNPGHNQRQELAEASLQTVCELLGTDSTAPLKVRNALGQEMPYQKSHDGKLLLSVTLQPESQVVYTVTKGEPKAFKSQVSGRIYPERLDDLTWENDRGIYRIYGPALQRKGEQSFGTDVWVKNTPEPVVEYRYRQHMDGWRQGDSLRKAGKKEEGEELFRNTSFHLDHGQGMDVYSVGPSLGCGAPALMKDGQLVFPYCFKDCKILDNGPLRFTAELTYDTTDAGTTEHSRISLDKGSHYNRMTVWYDGIKSPTALATGVVLHGSDRLITDKKYILYADPTDNPKVHQSLIFVGTLFPDTADEAIKLSGKPNHAVGIIRQYKGQPYTYYFGSAWSLYDVPTMAHWQLLADEYLENIKTPLTIKITKTK